MNLDDHKCQCPGRGYCEVLKSFVTTREQQKCSRHPEIPEPVATAYIEAIYRKIGQPVTTTPTEIKRPILKSIKAAVFGDAPDPVMGRYAGTNLALLLKRFSIDVRTGCNCEEWIDKMNRWTPSENYQHRKEIIERLKDQSKELQRLGQLGVLSKIKIGFLMLRNLNMPTIQELVDEAIYQARQHSLTSE